MLFKLIAGQLNRPTELRRTIARRLLETHIDSLEHNTRKIRILCESELRTVARSGTLRAGSCLHAILVTVALHLETDAGELESLNSMIKSQMARANNFNISLHLLSARVNARKTMTMAASAVSSANNAAQSLRVVKPIACELATSSPLYQDLGRESLNNLYRWSPPEPVKLTTRSAEVCAGP